MILREATLDYLSKHRKAALRINPAIRNVVEAIAKKYESKAGANDGWLSPDIPWHKLEEKCTEDPGSLMEAHGSAAWGSLMRAGIQMMANTWYNRYDNSCLKIAQETSSDKRQEWYAPLFGSNWPRKIEAGTRFPEQEIKGQDLELINVKWGQIEAFTRELFDDDQTGQIQDRARHMGEATAGWEDAYFSRRFIGAADATSYPEAIEASGWSGVNAVGTAITTPFSVNMYTTAIGNRPAAYVQLGYGVLLTAFQRLRQALDPLGVPIVTNPNRLLVSTFDEINAKMLVSSATAPYVPPATGGAGQGLARGAYAENPLVGMVQPVVNIHLRPGVWALVEAHRGYVLQRRDPMEIVQEQPQTGASFDTDTMRFRTRTRWEQDWIDPRFAYLGNDGSASLSQP